jgi:hypothetical protein
MSKKAFDKIAAGLEGASSAARDEKNPDMEAYIIDPTLENYVKCRRLGFEPNYPTFSGNLAYSEVNEILKPHDNINISENDLWNISCANEETIQKLSLKLIEDTYTHKTLKKTGQSSIIRRGKALPNDLVDWLICLMLDSLHFNDKIKISKDLLMLIRSRLIASQSRIKENINKKRSAHDACWHGGHLIATGKTASFRAVAQLMEVQTSTVSRWFNSEIEFQERAEFNSRFFDENGNRKSREDCDAVLHEKERVQQS